MSRRDPNELERARRLFALGHSVRDVARMIGIHRVTASKWKSQDAADGLDWADLRASTRATTPLAIVAVLERRLVRTAEDDRLSATARAYALREIHGVLERERDYAARTLQDSATINTGGRNEAGSAGT